MLIALCAGRATSAMIALCAVRSIQTCAWPSMHIRYRTVHPANAGEFNAHRQTRAKSSRPYSIVALLFVREYICKPLAICKPRTLLCAERLAHSIIFNVYPACEKKYKSKTKQLQKTEIVLHKLSTNPLVIKIDAQRSLVHIISNFSVFR
jgi:hypothetical protein